MEKKVFKILQSIEDIKSKPLPFVRLNANNEIARAGTTQKFITNIRGSKILNIYNEITSNPDLPFCTCIDKNLKNEKFTKDTFSRTYLPCLVKSARYGNPDFTTVELIASRICAMLGIKSAYITADAQDNRMYISPYFLANNEKLIDVSQATSAWWLNASFTPFDIWMIRLESFFNELPFDSCNKDELIVDFVRLYIAKKFILNDKDVTARNIGFIYNNNSKKYTIAPAYDFEFCLNMMIDIFEFNNIPDNELCKNMFGYLFENYPHLIDKIMTGFKENEIDFNRINAIINRFEKRPEKAKEIYDIICRSVRSLNTLYNSSLAKDIEIGARK